MKIFAHRLKEQVSHLGISNAEAARRAGLAERRFNNYSNDEREPDLATLVRIAEALQTTPDRLLGVGDKPMPSSRALLVDRLVSAAQALEDHDLGLVVVQVEALGLRPRGKAKPRKKAKS